MASVVRGILKSIKDKGIGTFWRELKEEGYLKCLPDGNLLQTKIHNIGATLVGVDKFGNKYYQRVDEETQYGTDGLEYAEKGRYNASQVPPEWHGWLHHITDHTGDEKPNCKNENIRRFVNIYRYITNRKARHCLLMLKPSRYGIEHKENFSGEGEELIYHSKGHALNPGQRDWTRYQSWQPTKS